MPNSRGNGNLGYISELRRALSECSQKYASAAGAPHRLSYGGVPTVVFEPDPQGPRHGNFMTSSYRAILRNRSWQRRLVKTHSQRKRLPQPDNGCWSELDSCNSSDALLMNIFCYPRILAYMPVASLLGVDTEGVPEFGYRARVPLQGGRFDRTEVDMRLGSLLVEAKLTEADFQRREKTAVERYPDFSEVFDCGRLPQSASEYFNYQLIRNVLAAHALGCSFCLMCDSRRPDLIGLWFEVLQCVRPVALRLRCKLLTWQELAATLPPKLQKFLLQKYAILGTPAGFSA